MSCLRFTSSVLTFAVLTLLAGCGGASSNTPGVISPALTSSTTALAVSPNPATPGAVITMVATVTAGSFTPVGTVTFYDGTTSLGNSAVTTTGSASTATLTVNTFASNTMHALSAAYSGDAIHAVSTSSTVSVAISGAAGAPAITAHAAFSFSAANQTISGFGAAEAFDLTYLDSHPYSAEMYNALFDPTAGLGLTYLRVQDLYRGSGTGFDPDTPSIVAAANTAHGTPLTILMSSWSPPANLKSNASVNGCTSMTNGNCTGGIGTLVMVNGAYDYADFAQYWYDSLAAYSALGVNPTYISIQNEPDFSATYAACRFNPTEATYNGTNYAGYGLAFDAVYKKLQGLSTPPTMIGPETLGAGQSFLDLAAQIPTNETNTYAHHLYNVSSGSASPGGVITPGGSPDSGTAALTKLNATYPNANKFATEYYDTPGFYDAWTIHNALVYGNDNAYVFWQAVWPSTLTTAKDQSADQEGLLYADNPGANQATWVFPHGWSYNDAYYALKHFSYYVRPGYVRYNATVDNPDERVSIYQSADKKTTVIVALNVSTSATDGLSLDLSSITYANAAIYRSTFSQPITSGERWASLGTYIAPSAGSNGANNSGGINLPPQSAVTIVLTN
jgi:glucuronoarabinoxylan endo-1,4-beta-xylanase